MKENSKMLKGLPKRILSLVLTLAMVVTSLVMPNYMITASAADNYTYEYGEKYESGKTNFNNSCGSCRTVFRGGSSEWSCPEDFATFLVNAKSLSWDGDKICCNSGHELVVRSAANNDSIPVSELINAEPGTGVDIYTLPSGTVLKNNYSFSVYLDIWGYQSEYYMDIKTEGADIVIEAGKTYTLEHDTGVRVSAVYGGDGSKDAPYLANYIMTHGGYADDIPISAESYIKNNTEKTLQILCLDHDDWGTGSLVNPYIWLLDTSISDYDCQSYVGTFHESIKDAIPCNGTIQIKDFPRLIQSLNSYDGDSKYFWVGEYGWGAPILPPAPVHYHNYQWKYSDTEHWQECSNTDGECELQEKNRGSHTWDDGTVKTSATCSSKGIREYTCTACEKTKTEDISIDSTKHSNITKKEAKSATCFAEGISTTYWECSGCHKYFSNESGTTEIPAATVEGYKIAKLSHTWTYSIKNNVLTASCSATGCTAKTTLTLTAIQQTYSGSAYSGASNNNSVTNFTSTTETVLGDVEYYLSDGTTKTSVSNSGAVGDGKAPKNAGNYVAKISVTDKNSTTDVKATVEKAFTISPKSVNGLTDVTAMVGDTNEPIYDNGIDKTPVVIVKDGTTTLAEGTDYTLSGDTTKGAVGTYTITITGKGNYTGTKDLTWKIIGKDFNSSDITANGYSGIYDGQEHKIAVILSGEAVGSTVEYSTDDGTTWSTENPSVKNASTTAVNYRVTKEGYNQVSDSKTITINKKQIGIDWSNLSFTYNGQEQKPTAVAQVVDVVAGETVDVSVAGSQINAGTYTATASITDTNYVIKEASKTVNFTILAVNQGTPAVKEGYTIDNVEETITVLDGYEVNDSSAFDGTDYISGTVVKPNTTYYVRKKASGTNVNASPVTPFTTPTRATKPATPVLDKKSDVSIKITPVAGVEYSIDGENWNTTGEFTGLTAGETYEVKARVKATTEKFASEIVTNDVKTKNSAPTAPTDLTSTKPTTNGGSDGKITGVDATMEYSVDGGNTWTAVTGTEITGLSSGDVKVRVKETETTVPGNSTTVTVEINNSPKNLVAVSESEADTKDGKITGVTEAMEYSTDGGNTWVAVSGTEITGLSAGDVKVRLKATENSPAGDITVVEVKQHVHNWSAYVNDNNASTQANGTETRTCATCGKKEIREIPDSKIVVPVNSVDGQSAAEGAGLIKTSVNVDKTVPVSQIDNLNVATAKTLLTKEEKEQVDAGATVSIFLDITNIDEKVTAQDKSKIAEEVQKFSGSSSVGMYLDLSLFKKVSTEEKATRITETGNNALKITVAVPEKLLEVPAGMERSYAIVRIHDGKADVLNTFFDKETGKLSFETDRFSTYAIIYSDIELPSGDDDDDDSNDGTPAGTSPATGDMTPITLYVVMLLGSIVALASVMFTGKKRRS